MRIRRKPGASSGNRTRIGGMEDRGPTLGRSPHKGAFYSAGAMEENRTPVASLARSYSTVELPSQISGANSGNRTRIGGLEDRGPTVGRCSLYLIHFLFY